MDFVEDDVLFCMWDSCGETMRDCSSHGRWKKQCILTTCRQFIKKESKNSMEQLSPCPQAFTGPGGSQKRRGEILAAESDRRGAPADEGKRSLPQVLRDTLKHDKLTKDRGHATASTNPSTTRAAEGFVEAAVSLLTQGAAPGHTEPARPRSGVLTGVEFEPERNGLGCPRRLHQSSAALLRNERHRTLMHGYQLGGATPGAGSGRPARGQQDSSSSDGAAFVTDNIRPLLLSAEGLMGGRFCRLFHKGMLLPKEEDRGMRPPSLALAPCTPGTMERAAPQKDGSEGRSSGSASATSTGTRKKEGEQFLAERGSRVSSVVPGRVRKNNHLFEDDVRAFHFAGLFNSGLGVVERGVGALQNAHKNYQEIEFRKTVVVEKLLAELVRDFNGACDRAAGAKWDDATQALAEDGGGSAASTTTSWMNDLPRLLQRVDTTDLPRLSRFEERPSPADEDHAAPPVVTTTDVYTILSGFGDDASITIRGVSDLHQHLRKDLKIWQAGDGEAAEWRRFAISAKVAGEVTFGGQIAAAMQDGASGMPSAESLGKTEAVEAVHWWWERNSAELERARKMVAEMRLVAVGGASEFGQSEGAGAGEFGQRGIFGLYDRGVMEAVSEKMIPGVLGAFKGFGDRVTDFLGAVQGVLVEE